MVAESLGPDERARRIVDWLTTERVAYGGIVIVALGVRLFGLGESPLTPGEASQALPAAQAARGMLPDLAGISPLLYALQRAVFALFGASDASARFWPALVGGLSPLLFYGLRGPLTRGGALMAALLWAFSPLGVWSGRLALGDSLVAPLALALMAALAACVGAEEAGRPRAAIATGATLGLLLISGPNAYTMLVAMAVGALLLGFDFGALGRSLNAHRRPALLAFATAAVLGSTFFFLTPAGLAAAVGLAGDWLQGALPGNGEYAAWELVYRLLMSEFVLFALAVAGVLAAAARRERFGLAVAVATALVWLLSIAGGGRRPVDLAPVALGLALLAGPVAARIVSNARSWTDSRDAWVLVGVSAALLFAALVAFPGAWNPSAREDWRTIFAGIFVATGVLFVVIWIAYGIWDGWELVGRTLPAVLLVFALAWQVSQLSGLSFERGAWRQPGVLHETPASGLRDFRETLRNLSALKRGGADDAPVDLVWPERPGDPALALLRWELRDFEGLRVTGATPNDPAPIVITPVEEQPRLASGYSGAEFAIVTSWRPVGLGGFDAVRRWVLSREARTGADEVRAILWFDRGQ